MGTAAPNVARPIRRVAAGVIDFAVTMLGAGAVALLWREGSYGASELELALIVYSLYHAAFYWLWDGQTPGLAVFEIRLVGMAGGALLVAQAALRGAMRPFALYALGWSTWLGAHRPELVAVAVLTVLGIELGMMFTLPTRQTLSDLLSRTLAINVPPPEPLPEPAAPAYGDDARFGVRPQQVR